MYFGSLVPGAIIGILGGAGRTRTYLNDKPKTEESNTFRLPLKNCVPPITEINIFEKDVTGILGYIMQMKLDFSSLPINP